MVILEQLYFLPHGRHQIKWEEIGHLLIIPALMLKLMQNLMDWSLDTQSFAEETDWFRSNLIEICHIWTVFRRKHTG